MPSRKLYLPCRLAGDVRALALFAGYGGYVGLTLFATACGRPETASDRQFAEMSEQVTSVQDDHDSFDRRLSGRDTTDGLEAESSQLKGSRADARPSTERAGPASLAVQLGGPSDDESADPSDPSARPEVRLQGAAGASPLRVRSSKTSSRARVESVSPASDSNLDAEASRVAGARPSALDPEAKRSYETALSQVQAKQYDRGLDALQAFVVRWPDHPYVENALYWRGEAYFAQAEYVRAIPQFEGVLSRFGTGNKAPDALLKLGMCHDRLGDTVRARESWERLLNAYPRSDAAKKVPATSGREPKKGNR